MSALIPWKCCFHLQISASNCSVLLVSFEFRWSDYLFLLYSQFSSSLPSPQSSVKSHTQSSGTHNPWEQVNSSGKQPPTDTGVKTRETANSSHTEPSSSVISLVIVCPLTSNLQVKHFIVRTWRGTSVKAEIFLHRAWIDPVRVFKLLSCCKG